MRSRSRVLVVVAFAATLGSLASLPLTETRAADPAAGDPARGAMLFRQCAACHSVEPGLHLTGPSLAAIWGRPAGTVGGFGRYTTALKHAGITWDAATLDRWLARPASVVPDTSMTFPGVADARQRADLVAYLKAVSEGKAPPTPGGGMMGAGPRTDLKRVGKDRRVTAIRHCGDAYHVTTEAGRTIPFWEFNLHFKTDSSPHGPEPGKPVLAPQGMQGDRAQVVLQQPRRTQALSRRVLRAGRAMTARSLLRLLGLPLTMTAALSAGALAQQGPLTREGLVAAAERAPGPVKGREEAPITIVEFSDFQCTYCRKFWRDTFPKLEAEYVNTGKVRFIYRHFVAFGPISEQAAEAAACAQEQGKFWAYHDALFERHGRLPDAATMAQLRVDSTAFDACIASGRHKERILVESAMARRLGASGTPTFLINGKLLIGAHPFETFKPILDTLGKELSVPASADPGVPSRP